MEQPFSASLCPSVIILKLLLSLKAPFLTTHSSLSKDSKTHPKLLSSPHLLSFFLYFSYFSKEGKPHFTPVSESSTFFVLYIIL
jgi:hypothetical protein